MSYLIGQRADSSAADKIIKALQKGEAEQTGNSKQKTGEGWKRIQKNWTGEEGQERNTVTSAMRTLKRDQRNEHRTKFYEI